MVCTTKQKLTRKNCFRPIDHAQRQKLQVHDKFIVADFAICAASGVGDKLLGARGDFVTGGSQGVEDFRLGQDAVGVGIGCLEGILEVDLLLEDHETKKLVKAESPVSVRIGRRHQTFAVSLCCLSLYPAAKRSSIELVENVQKLGTINFAIAAFIENLENGGIVASLVFRDHGPETGRSHRRRRTGERARGCGKEMDKQIKREPFTNGDGTI
jgi:hypothetical protein